MKISDEIVLSVIIPCYNHGNFIDEAIHSIYELANVNYEIIIIDDGSTDEFTKNKLQELSLRGHKIIHKCNEGPGKARNDGIRAAKGKYIIPLDADNKIKPEYIHSALPLLDNNQADIIYAKPIFFGENLKEREFNTIQFNPYKLLNENYIDACAIYRKNVWIKNNGYAIDMPNKGHEDWEFWLNSYSNEFRFKFIDRELFYYRICKDSLITKVIAEESYNASYKYIVKKHSKLYGKPSYIIRKILSKILRHTIPFLFYKYR